MNLLATSSRQYKESRMTPFAPFLISLGALIATVAGQQTCGQPTLPAGFEPDPSQRIIGGQDMMPNVWPWQLAIETDTGAEFRLHCGGVVIDANWGVTAAHCVTPRPGTLMSIAGLYNRSLPFTGTQIRFLTPDQITIHPDFDADTLLNDLAVIHFSTPLDLSTPRVKAICLPPSASSSYVENPNCFITGWGLTQPDGELAESLRRIYTDVIGPMHCELRHGRPILPSEQCTIDEVARINTPCHGDMGGPLGCAIDARFYLAGVGSIVRENCDARFPQIYTNVAHFVDWIRDVTGLRTD